MVQDNGWRDEEIRRLARGADELEERMRLVESKWDRFYGAILALSTIGGLIGSSLVLLFRVFVLKSP